MKSPKQSWEDKIRQICTYYSELGEGTAGYSLSEEQFQKLFGLVSSLLKAEREGLINTIKDKLKSSPLNLDDRPEDMIWAYKKYFVDEMLEELEKSND